MPCRSPPRYKAHPIGAVVRSGPHSDIAGWLSRFGVLGLSRKRDRSHEKNRKNISPFHNTPPQDARPPKRSIGYATTARPSNKNRQAQAAFTLLRQMPHPFQHRPQIRLLLVPAHLRDLFRPRPTPGQARSGLRDPEAA